MSDILTSEIKTKIILDSRINDIRVTTFELYYPRIVHAELMTHRVFSRNASSSRAIPVETMIKNHANYIPENWRENQKGMQPAGFIEKTEDNVIASHIWTEARNNAITSARKLMELGVAKEQANRLLEPFMFIKVIVTSTDYYNFFSLRSHPDAQYEIRILSESMEKLYYSNIPVKRSVHLPYLENNNTVSLDMIKCSVARCARVSYATHDGKPPTIENDVILYDRLVGSKPLHASPAEHQVFDEYFFHAFRVNNNLSNWPVNTEKLNGNLKKGVIQYRKILERIS